MRGAGLKAETDRVLAKKFELQIRKRIAECLVFEKLKISVFDRISAKGGKIDEPIRYKQGLNFKSEQRKEIIGNSSIQIKKQPSSV